MQLNYPDKQLDIPLDRREAVMCMKADLVIGFPLQPAPHYLRFVRLATTNALQVTPCR